MLRCRLLPLLLWLCLVPVRAQTKAEIDTMPAALALGERVEDVFLVDGGSLNNPRVLVQLETELLDALAI